MMILFLIMCASLFLLPCTCLFEPSDLRSDGQCVVLFLFTCIFLFFAYHELFVFDPLIIDPMVEIKSPKPTGSLLRPKLLLISLLFCYFHYCFFTSWISFHLNSLSKFIKILLRCVNCSSFHACLILLSFYFH